MEKGSSKTSKSNSDNKNKDVNKHLRLPRIKDNVPSRPEPRRKPNPQRNRELFDKRPRNKTGAFYEKYRSEVTLMEGAVGESVKYGGKKTNLNHLLNFTVASSDHWDGVRRPMHNRSKIPKYNKELFLQANCQFVARDNEDYSIHQTNPDILVEWSRIEQIRFPCHELPLCPICLYVPIAAKITRCGHIYCWSCMLHYLSLTDKTWQKCPICFEAVHQSDLKSVSVKMQKSFGIGDEVTLFLMQREKGSLISLPVVEQRSTNSVCTVHDVDSITRYQKLLLASYDEVQLILHKERFQLVEAYENEKNTPEVCFIELAIKLLDEKEKILNETFHNKMPSDSAGKNINTPSRKYLTSISSVDSNDEYSEMTETCEKSEYLDTETSHVSFESECKSSTFFYQAEDGQHIYLHNLNVRMLKEEYHSLEFGPPQITAKVVDVESVTMTEALRKRLRYLQHLPLTCEFQIVELDFGDLVSRETLVQFEGDIKKRKILRCKKARDERRREKMIEVEENKKLGKYPKATYNLNSSDQFPVYNPEDFISLSPPKHEPEIQNADVNSNVLWKDVDNNSTNSNAPGTSFAQMLKEGSKKFVQTPKEKIPIQLPIPNENDDEEFNAAPEYRQSFGDAIQAALDAMTLNEHSANNASSSKKKKKGKKQLLFTTSMCRNK